METKNLHTFGLLSTKSITRWKASGQLLSVIIELFSLFLTVETL